MDMILWKGCGLISILGGIYFLYLVYGPLPKNQKRKENLEIWRLNFGKIIKILSSIMIIGGIIMLLS
jgi:hypothetical protein